MNIRILGAGCYGAYLATALIADNHDVVVHEIADRVFAGASGAIPARLHIGPHYSRSKLTRQACQEHHAEFMGRFGNLTHGVPVNLYCIAEHDSLVDFGTYVQILRKEIEFITVARPAELGLQNIEGAILTGERHILVDKLREYFTKALEGRICFNTPPGNVDDPAWDVTLDATFCAHEQIGIDRFEACLTLLLEGPTDRAITVCDGKFPSLYPWDEEQGLCSLTSAKWTPLAKRTTWKDARLFLDEHCPKGRIQEHANAMFDQMSYFFPRLRDEYKIVDYRTAIRAMPRSASDARLCEVIRVGERGIRIRAGKLDAIFHAEREVKRMLKEMAA